MDGYADAGVTHHQRRPVCQGEPDRIPIPSLRAVLYSRGARVPHRREQTEHLPRRQGREAQRDVPERVGSRHEDNRVGLLGVDGTPYGCIVLILLLAAFAVAGMLDTQDTRAWRESWREQTAFMGEAMP